MFRRRVLVIAFVLLLATNALPGINLLNLQAKPNLQANTIPLTVVLPEWLRDVMTEKVIQDFESANPNVKLYIKTSQRFVTPAGFAGLDKHLEETEKIVTEGDVIFDQFGLVTPQTTAAGYFLNLAPLVAGDKDTSDFLPAAYQATQWDGGVWGLPVAGDVTVFAYNPEAFDKAGLAYPNEKWTIDDLVNAVRKLTEKDEAGKVKQLAIEYFTSSGEFPLLLSLSGEALLDTTTVPNTPKFDKPSLEKVLSTWTALQQEGLLDRPQSGGTFRPGQSPMSLISAGNLQFMPPGTPKLVGMMMPGGKSVLSISKVVVSGATQYPEQAYALAKFLTTRAEFPNRTGSFPARKSLENVTPTGQTFVRPKPTPEIQALIDQGKANGLTTADLRYIDYVQSAMSQVRQKKAEIKAALQEAEAKAVKDMQAAAAKKGSKPLAVATPAPRIQLGQGQISLRFAYQGAFSGSGSNERWNALVKEFTANDPQVKDIQLESNFNFGNIAETSKRFDCASTSFSLVNDQNLKYLLPIDPFLAADAGFDKSDFVGGALDQLSRDNKVFGYPFSITPSVLKYHGEVFAKAGVAAPPRQWTIENFTETVKALKSANATEVPFQPRGDGAYMLSLIAAYGGLPMDFRQTPATLNFISAENVAAITQALDLAKNGYIKYSELGTLQGGGGGFGSSQMTIPIYNTELNQFSFQVRSTSDSRPPDPYLPTTFPRGKTYSAFGYRASGAHIFTTAQSPEACYRWIKFLGQHPELFNEMPARRSHFNNPALEAAQGKAAVEAYRAIDELLKDPNTIRLDNFNDPSGFLVRYFLFQAFDAYVLKNQELEPALKQAEEKGKALQTCIAKVPPFTVETQREYVRALAACVKPLDPSLSSIFAGIE